MTMEAQGQKGADLDPDIRRFVQAVNAEFARHPNFNALSPALAREVVEQARAPWAQGGPEMAETVEVSVPTREGEVRLRIYRPSPGAQNPALIYLHGGGWTLFSLDTHDRLMREYAARASIVVVGVDYALAPENKFPVAMHQVTDVVRWLAKEGTSVGIDPERLALGGDSAGGNLTMSTALLLRDTDESHLIKGMVFNYGAFTNQDSEEYHRRYGGEGYMLSSEEMVVYWENYMRDEDDAQNPYLCSILAELHDLPPAFMVIPECDVLSEQSLKMADKLRSAGVAVEAVVYEGATHSFLEAVSISALAGRALDDTAAWLQTTLAVEA